MHVPVVMVTALDQTSDKVQGLEAGADDFLTKPVDDIALITRVKNLARLKTLNDEMLLRMATGAEIGALPGGSPGVVEGGCRRPHAAGRGPGARRRAACVAVLGQDRTRSTSSPICRRRLLRLGEHALRSSLIVSLNLAEADGLRLCSQVRSLERTRHLPIIVVVQPSEEARLLRALDMGVNDYLMRPIDRNELLARVRTQIKRKRHSDHLRDRLEESVELAVTDALTGLHNRRYMETHLKALAEQARAAGRPLSVLLADIDNFKSINDTYGHDAGDNVLREFAARFRRNTRGIDLACRIGGEEFVVVMPDTALERACQVGERLRACIAGEPFQANGETRLHGDRQRRDCHARRPHDSAGGAPQARRPGALRRQARRPQPRGCRRGLADGQQA